MASIGQDGGCCEKRDQIRAGGVFGVRRHTGGEQRDPLHLGGQRPDVIDARDRQQLADLLKTDLGFAARHHGANTLALNKDGFRLQLVRDAEPLEELRSTDTVR